MRRVSGKLRLTATDLSNHLACRHLTALDIDVAHNRRAAPQILAPDLKVIQELGLRHEQDYLSYLESEKKLSVVNLKDIHDEKDRLEQTRRLMAQGADAIAQGALGDAEWLGYPDVLLRLPKPSGNWLWSYEVVDTKLARETKAGTILQLSLYSELLAKVQGSYPEFLWVVPPGNFAGESYRVSEYAAYYRYVKSRLARVAKNGNANTYPEPVEHCNICRWFKECDARRRSDDHLSLVAGIRRLQRRQLEDWNIATVAKLAVLPIPIKERPAHGTRESIEAVREQARVQVEGRAKSLLLYELLPVANGLGLTRLPEPSLGDLFLDLEGDRFVGEHGLQYLFGFAARNPEGQLVYEKRWALNREEEKKSFEWLVDEIMHRRAADPALHIYHFGAYEPSTLKSLMGLHATREDEIDRLLRAEAFVDLHRIFRQSVRASVEEYSLKKLEAFPGFVRQVALDDSRRAMRFIEHRLELEKSLDDLPEDVHGFMEGYNRDDCFAAAIVRDWLESRRAEVLARGESIPRPAPQDEAPSEELEERQKRVAALVSELTAGIPADSAERTEEQQALWLLAQLQDWHRREAKPSAWRYFQLQGMDDADLLEERDAVSGLVWVGKTMVDGCSADRYSFPNQETNVRAGGKKEVHYKDQRIGTVVGLDPIGRTIDIRKSLQAADVRPTSIFVREPYRQAKAQQDALYRLGCWVRDNGIVPSRPWRGALSFLLRQPPRLLGSESLHIRNTEDFSDELARVVSKLDSSILAVQGPPGSGKTTSAAHAIESLVRNQKMRIGVTALSHSVIRHLLMTIVTEVSGAVRCMHKSDGKEKEADLSEEILVTTKNEIALRGIKQRTIDVLGGTSFLWAREEFSNSVDVLFVDEASQVSLADLLAISQASPNIVLIGDPQQLPRPGEAAHPPGAELSCLEHIMTDSKLGRLKTIPPSLGLFIDQTKRLHPKVCDFTSTLFYESRLSSHSMTRPRIIEGHPWLKGAGLWFVPVEHEGNRNSSIEEIDVIGRIVDGLRRKGVTWFRGEGRPTQLEPKDILIVAPYNAQVSDLGARFSEIQIGTVDKFQGKQAAVVIYSLTTSSPEDVPHGMEFLYSLNRLNVATSRAMTAVIVVGSPKLFEPECRTPRQMQLANALCGFREMAAEISPNAI